jgi:hypothetical protein
MVNRVVTTARVEPIGGRNLPARGRATVAAWLGVLAVIVGLAIVGRLTDPGVATPRSAAIAFAAPLAGPTRAPAPVAAAILPSAGELIVLTSPAAAGITVTTRELVVLGYVQSGADSVRVTLEARGNRIIDDATVTPGLARDDGPIASRLPRFEVRFGLPNPRPNGRMIVQVVAFDSVGRMLDVVRRPFRVGPVFDPGTT